MTSSTDLLCRKKPTEGKEIVEGLGIRHRDVKGLLSERELSNKGPDEDPLRFGSVPDERLVPSHQ